MGKDKTSLARIPSNSDGKQIWILCPNIRGRARVFERPGKARLKLSNAFGIRLFSSKWNAVPCEKVYLIIRTPVK